MVFVCCKFRSSWSSGGDGKKVKGKKDKNATADELLEVVPIPSHNFKLECAVLTRRGYYPDTPNKENQDCFCIKTCIQGNPNVHFFGVFDGHGGHQVIIFCFFFFWVLYIFIYFYTLFM